ncbi:MAG TPA: hypothetical protein VFX86_03340 [Candidatus Saccharimonadales bacterium]|nr:hypothetical protein [Candidatus Saccharimonadales bacterium]
MAAGQFLSVGYGNVGQAVPERAAELGLEQSPLVVRSDAIYALEDGSRFDKGEEFWADPEVIKGVDAAFIAMPSFDDGERARDIIKGLVNNGIAVVTAEKGALANHYAELEPMMENIGISATVGGGTQMMPSLALKLNSRTRQVHAIVNGTLNFVVDGIANGRTAGQTIDEAVKLGYAEPGASNHLEVMNGELVGDIPKKASILWNTVFRPVFAPDQVLSHTDLEQPELNQENLSRLIAEAGSRRYILSIVREDDELPEEDTIVGFREEVDDGWVIMGGFRRITDNPLFQPLKIAGPGNGAVIANGPDESDGTYVVGSGPGAGPGPTAAAMVQDARQILRAN